MARGYKDDGKRRPAWATCDRCGWAETFPIDDDGSNTEAAKQLAIDATARHVCPPYSLDRLWVSHPNPETEALKSCADALDSLTPEAVRRVLDYLNARYATEPTR